MEGHITNAIPGIYVTTLTGYVRSIPTVTEVKQEIKNAEQQILSIISTLERMGVTITDLDLIQTGAGVGNVHLTVMLRS